MRTGPGLVAAERAIALDATDARGHIVLALLEQRRRRHLAALAAAAEAVRLAPEDPRCHIVHGELLFGGGVVGTADHAEAEAAFREALRLAPESDRARYGLGKALVLQGRHDEAETFLDTVVEALPHHAEAYYWRGLVRMRQRELEEAEADFRQATDLDPSLAAAWFNRARVLRMMGRNAAADGATFRHETAKEEDERSESYEISYHGDTDASGPALLLARYLASRGRLDEALRVAESFAVDHPDIGPAWIVLAEVATTATFLELASEAAEKALDLASGNPKALAAAEGAAGLRQALARDDEAQRRIRESFRGFLLRPGDPAAAESYAALLEETGQGKQAGQVRARSARFGVEP
jgi:tetratricopeptide (TPR) repeat protein